MAIEFKRLPPHWDYPLQRNQLKALLIRMNADFRAVQLLGTARKPAKITAGLFTAGYLDAHLGDAGWCFRLRLYGLPEELLDRSSHGIGDTISRDIDRFVAERLADSVGSVGRDLKRIFFLREQPEDLVPSFSTARVEGGSELVAQLDQWWLSAPAVY